MASFKDKLERLCAWADERSSNEINKELIHISNFVVDIIKKRQWAEVPIKIQNDINKTAEAMRVYTKLGDAAELINESVLKAKSGNVYDISLYPDFDSSIKQIEYFFKGKESDRGFVYVAWRGRPEAFLYVGKASSKSRLDLRKNAKLARAITRATTFSVVYPKINNLEILKGLEASIICVINSEGYHTIEFNDKTEIVPYGAASGVFHGVVQRLGSFLTEITEKMER